MTGHFNKLEMLLHYSLNAHKLNVDELKHEITVAQHHGSLQNAITILSWCHCEFMYLSLHYTNNYTLSFIKNTFNPHESIWTPSAFTLHWTSQSTETLGEKLSEMSSEKLSGSNEAFYKWDKSQYMLLPWLYWSWNSEKTNSLATKSIFTLSWSAHLNRRH